MSVPNRAIPRINAITEELWQIADKGDVSQLDAVLGRGAEINGANSNGVTALMRAAAAGNEEFVRKLVEHGANVDAHRNDGFNSLLLATFFGHLGTVQALVENGANVDSTSHCGKSAEEWARSRTFDEIARYLQEARRSRRSGMPLKPVERFVAPKPVVVEGVFNEQAVPTAEPIASHQRAKLPVEDDWVSDQAATDQPATTEVRTLNDPPEIWELVHSAPPEFNPGKAFILRATSSRINRILLCLFLCAVAGASVYGFLRFRKQSNTPVPPVTQSAAHAVPARANLTQPNSQSSENSSAVSTNPGEQPPADVGSTLVDPHSTAADLRTGSRSTTKRRLNKSSANSTEETVSTPTAEPKPVNNESTASQKAKQPTTTALSPQLIGPPKSEPTPKPKVIQWP
jgi:hypothetical protein